MNGHRQLIAMRSKGQRPKIVFLNDWPCRTDWFETGDHITVSLEPIDNPELLDLRFLLGTTVSLSSHSEQRAKRLLAACQLFEASVVAAAHIQPINKYRCETGWSEIWRSE